MRIDDESTYREGVVLDRPIKKGDGSFVNIGLRKEIQVDKHLQAGTRVTVKLQSSSQGKNIFICFLAIPVYVVNHLDRNIF